MRCYASDPDCRVTLKQSNVAERGRRASFCPPQAFSPAVRLRLGPAQAMRASDKSSALSWRLRLCRLNMSQVKEAAMEVSAARGWRERAKAAARLVAIALTGEPARVIARLLICSYYINLVYSELETWQQLHSPEAQLQARRWPEPGSPSELPFPWLHVFGVLPVALLAAVGVVPPAPLFAGTLLAFTLAKDAWLTYASLRNILLHGGRPTELVMKQLALIGSAALMFAYSIREAPRLQAATAGLLRHDDAGRPPAPGVKRSTLLLAARLFLAALLLFAGYQQVLRIRAKASAARFEAGSHHYGRSDPHDNNLVLLECLLGVLLALGLWTTGVTRLLCIVLLVEAATQWRWWLPDMPSWHFRQHIREHAFTNAAAAGGLLLMQSFGAGVFTVDSLLAAKQD